MSISFPPISQVPTKVNNTALILPPSASTELIPVNTNRASGGLIVNSNAAIVWIRLGDSTVPATANPATCISIPASGGNYLLPPNYQGAVQFIMPTSTTRNGTIQFIEPVYA